MNKELVENLVKDIMTHKTDKDKVAKLTSALAAELKDIFAGVAAVSVIEFDLLYKGYEGQENGKRRTYEVEALNDFFKKNGFDVTYS